MSINHIISIVGIFITICVVIVVIMSSITSNSYPSSTDTVIDTYQNTNSDSDKINNTRFKYTNPEVVTQIYKLLCITDKIFTDNKIEYWMDGGTFLGAIRSGGIIKWDSDADLQVWSKDEALIQSLQPEFAKYNIRLHDTWFGYKLYFNDAQTIKGHKWLYPSIDLFPVNVDNNKIVYSYLKAQKLWGNTCYHDLATLYPLERYKFGPIELWGAPKISSNAYLKRSYGADWNTHGYEQFDHETEKAIKNKIKVKLTAEELEPAMFIEFSNNFKSIFE